MAELLNAKRARRASSGPIDRLDELVLSHPLAVGGDRQAQHEALGLHELSGGDHERRLACRHLRPLGRHVVVDLVAQQLPHLRLRRGERSRQQVDVAQGARFLADSARRTGAIGPDVGDEEPDEKPEDQSERCHQPRAERPQRGVVTATAHHEEHHEDEHHGQVQRKEDRRCQDHERNLREPRDHGGQPPSPGHAGIHRGDLGHRFTAPGFRTRCSCGAILAAVGSPASR